MLTACSGGGGSAPAAPLTGVFVDSPVAGLAYDTPTQHGLTTASGEFHYLPGEQVTFRIGQLTLGTSPGTAVVTPLSLTGGNTADDPAALAMVRLLLTLDADDAPENGIQLDATDSARFTRKQLFSATTDVAALINETGVGYTLVDSDYARRHFALSLAALKGSVPTARYALVSESGSAATGTGQHACATDKETGLTWEVKTREGLRSASYRYKPAMERGLVNGGQCDPSLEMCTASDYAEKVNETRLCGFTDWRVPTEKELKTLWDPSQYTNKQAAIDRHAFPDAEPTFYWTDTLRGVEGFLAVWFDDTHKTLPSTTLAKSRYGAVRLVRGPILPDAPSRDDQPDPSFIPLNRSKKPVASGDATECVDINLRSIAGDLQKNELFALAPSLGSDPANQLLANSAISAQVSSSNSQSRCQMATWRAPTVSEMASLLSMAVDSDDAQKTDPAFAQAFPNVSPTTEWWANSNGSWVILGKNGSSREPVSGERARIMLLSKVARPVFVRKKAGEEMRPSASQFEQWRNSYAAFQPGQTRQPAWPAPELDDTVKAGFEDLGLLPAVPFPADNPYSKEKVALGQALFSEVKLSRNNTIACISCHDPKTGWSDSKELSEGHVGQLGSRNAMTILNTAYVKELFWDGRAKSLEDQAAGPIANPLEMHQSLGHAVSKIAADPNYAALFRAAFGDGTVTAERMTRAIATFERTIISKESAFDRFLKGDRTALSDDALWGMHLFRTKARCINCHNGALFSDNRFHSNGLHYYGRELEDLGRYRITGKPEDVGFFRTPTLRDILYSGNYMHNGLFPMTNGLGVIAMYNAGMVQTLPTGLFKYDPLYPKTSPEIRSLGLNRMETNALMEFMKAISAEPRTTPASEAELFRRQ